MIDHGRIVAQGSKAELLRGAGTFVRGAEMESLTRALKVAELSFSRDAHSSGFVVDAEPLTVGEAAAASGVVLTELRIADGGGLEELFLRLTAEDAREEVLS